MGLSVAATLLIATPVAAAPFTDGDITAGGTTWGVNDMQVEDSPTIEEADRDEWIGSQYTYDDGLEPIFVGSGDALEDWSTLVCAAEGDVSTALDETGDEIARCPLEPFNSGDGELEASYELRFFSDGETVRSRLTVTNETDEPVTGATVGFYEDYYQDLDTRVGASTTASDPAADETTVVNDDLIWVIYDALVDNDYETPVVLTAAGTADAEVSAVMAGSAGNGEDEQITLYPLPVLAPGESIEIVQFTVWNFFTFDAELEPTAAPTAGPTGAEAASEPTDVVQPREQGSVVTEEGLTKSAFLEPAALFAPSALAAVTESWQTRGRFDSLNARDSAGIADPTNVRNWSLAPAVIAEDGSVRGVLANTGPDEVLTIALGAAVVTLAGVSILAIRRRSAS